MPFYDFECKKCRKYYEALTPHDSTEKYPKVACPYCKSKSKLKLMSGFGIGGPTKSKMENFGYRAETNLEKAKDCRRAAEAASHMGTDVYNTIDDVSSGLYEGEVQ